MTCTGGREHPDDPAAPPPRVPRRHGLHRAAPGHPRPRVRPGRAPHRGRARPPLPREPHPRARGARSEEHTSELQSQFHLVCRLLLEKKKKTTHQHLCIKKKKKNK